MRRFYKQAAVGDARQILLDGRPVKTPGRRLLALPTDALANAVAREWDDQGEKVDPRSMSLTGLANAAIDRVAPDPAAFARGLAAYGESDLLYYRAEGPRPLAERQAELWDPILAWARARYDVAFDLTSGVIHRPQPPATVERLGQAVAARDSFALAGLSPLVAVSGSLIIALALGEGAIGPEEAWAAAILDEQWQAAQWGEDAEAAAALAGRRAEFETARLFLTLL